MQVREAKGGCTAVHRSVPLLKMFAPAAPQRDSVQFNYLAITYLETTAVVHAICEHVLSTLNISWRGEVGYAQLNVTVVVAVASQP